MREGCVAGLILTAMLWGCNSSERAAIAPSPTPTPVPQAPKCQLAAGYIWQNVQLYRDANCRETLAKIVSANGDEVLIRFDTGEVETKTRDAVKGQSYVLSNDPAIP